MGRPPKPTAILRLQGTLRPGRHADRAREPKPAPGAPLPPAWLMPEARAEWQRVCRAYGKAGILTGLDRAMLATFCQMWGRWVASEQADPYVPLPASFLATMGTIGNRLGLDPSGRARLRTPDAPPLPGSGWDQLMRVRRVN